MEIKANNGDTRYEVFYLSLVRFFRMVRQRLGTSLYASFLFLILGLIAWVSGQPFIFPSLGPSAFILAFDRRGERTRTYRIVGGHMIGVVAGWTAYSLFADGFSITSATDPATAAGFYLAISGVTSIALTTWAMIATDTNHPPACATTLIVSLGLLTTINEVVAIIVSVVILVESHQVVIRTFDKIIAYFETVDSNIASE